jgi:NDP-sugar pyrophosphorylase family protein
MIPMAGQGKRFIDKGIFVPKPLVVVNGKTLAEHAIDSIKIPGAMFHFITRNFDNSFYNKQLSMIFSDKLGNNFEEHCIYWEHHGAAHSCLFAEGLFKYNNFFDMPLIILNCDQILNWDVQDFLNFIEKNDPDGAVILYKSTNPKHSFAKINKRGEISEIIEKVAISDDALVGVHYWKKASDFFESAALLFDKQYWGSSEAYVSETYNFLIQKGKTILPYYFENDEYISLGTPEDIEEYLQNSNKKIKL